MGIYLTAKEYLIELKRQDNIVAIELLEEYEDIKAQSGEFIAAKYITDIYREFQSRLKDVSNG
jgi:hypothetical protein